MLQRHTSDPTFLIPDHPFSRNPLRSIPKLLSFDPSKPAKYPNGRVFTDDVINYRLAFLTKNECPPSGLKPHTDVLKEFPYLGTPHSK